MRANFVALGFGEDAQEASGIWSLPGSLIALLAAGILYRGIRESASINMMIVIVNVAILCLFVALGVGLVSSEKLLVNRTARRG